MAKKKHFKVFRSSAGFGLRALKDFKKGDVLLDYTGPIITNDEADENPNRYLFRLDDEKTIDGSPRSNLARYINHGCKPNAQAVHDEAKDRIYIEAIKKIIDGDEITYNYGPEYFDEYIKPGGCLCKKCTKKKAKAVEKVGA